MGLRFGFLKKKVYRTSIWEERPVRSETGIGFTQRASNNFVLMEQIHYGLVYGCISSCSWRVGEIVGESWHVTEVGSAYRFLEGKSHQNARLRRMVPVSGDRVSWCEKRLEVSLGRSLWWLDGRLLGCWM